MNPISVGIVGAGDICRRVHLPVLKNLDSVSIAWIADANGKTAETVGGLFGISHLAIDTNALSLPPCDVVLLATPVHSRKAYLEYFARAGICVFAEKPFAITASEHQAYVALFDQSSVNCAYMRRAYSNIRTLRRFVTSKWLGELRAIRYSEGNRITKTEFGSATLDLSYAKGGGVLRDLGCHGLDVISFITGAAGYTIDECRVEWDELTDRHVAARLTLSDLTYQSASTIAVDFTVSWLFKQDNTIELEFDNAVLRCGIKPDSMLQIASDSSFDDAVNVSVAEKGARSALQSYYLEWEAVLSALRTNIDSGFSAAGSLWTTRLVEELYVVGQSR